MEDNNVKYAGFFTRLLATLIDIIVISLIVNIIGVVIPLNAFVILMTWGLYVSLMIIKWRTTIGGKLFGIEVLKSDDLEPLNFKWASIRFFVSIAPFFLYLYLRGMQHIMDLPPSPTMSQLPQLIFMLLPMIMFFTKKKQMIHDFVARSVVIDVNIEINTDEVKKNKVVYTGQKILRVLGTLVFLAVFGYLLLYISVFYGLAKSSQNNYNASFSTHYKINDYNDSKIIFYNKELEKYSKEFIDANSMYDIFEADTKKDLAFNCIEELLQEHNVSEWLEEGSNFRKHARNKYSNTEEKIKKAKVNEEWMGRHFYYYDLNDVNDIESKIANIWDISKNKNTCDKLIPVEDLYKLFIMKYILNREETLKDYKKEYQHAKETGILNKSFYKKKIEKTTKWIDILYKNTPWYFTSLKKLEKKRQKKFWDSIEKGKIDNFDEIKGLNLNIKNNFGETPLIMTVKNNKLRCIRFFTKTIVNVHMKDNQGMSALDYANGKIKMMEALKELEAQQIVGDKAVVWYAYYLNNMNKVSIYINGAECHEFRFPDDMICKHIREYKNR